MICSNEQKPAIVHCSKYSTPNTILQKVLINLSNLIKSHIVNNTDFFILQLIYFWNLILISFTIFNLINNLQIFFFADKFFATQIGTYCTNPNTAISNYDQAIINLSRQFNICFTSNIDYLRIIQMHTSIKLYYSEQIIYDLYYSELYLLLRLMKLLQAYGTIGINRFFSIQTRSSLISNILSTRQLPEILQLYQKHNESFIPRSYALSSRMIGRFLSHSNITDNMQIQNFCKKLILIEYNLLSVEEGLAIAYFCRCYKNHYGEIPILLCQFVMSVYRHIKKLSDISQLRISLLVDYLIQLNYFLTYVNQNARQNKQFIEQVEQIKETLYSKILPRYPQNKTQKIDLIYHLLSLFNQLLQQNPKCIVKNIDIINKLMPDLKELTAQLNNSQLYRQINLLLGQLPKLLNNSTQEIQIKLIWYLQQLINRYVQIVLKQNSNAHQNKASIVLIKQKLGSIKMRESNVFHLCREVAVCLNKINKENLKSQIQ